jgi:hypothetical protein
MIVGVRDAHAAFLAIPFEHLVDQAGGQAIQCPG